LTKYHSIYSFLFSLLIKLTENGTKIEAVLATHPFHTLAFPAFHKSYPALKYYGTPRHLKNQPEIGWVGDLNDCKTRALWSPEVEMRIPAGIFKTYRFEPTSF
jgi:hypothetical protein